MLKTSLIGAVTLACALGASAQTSINLANYRLSGNHALATLGGMSLEASAVTDARDRGTLFFVGDEGHGVVEISRTRQTLGSMAFGNWPAASSNHDAEGLTYLGNGQLVVAEERLQDALRFTFLAGGSVALANAPTVSIGTTVGNIGTEGISYDPRDGSFVSVKQNAPQAVLGGRLNFATGTSTMTALFDASLLGLASLSDIQTLAPVDALAGSAAADNLLILSLDSRRLVEVNRAGRVLGFFDLSGITSQAIEGVTVDELGTIYLVAEDSGTPNSRLFVLTAVTAVPEPETYALMLGGLGGLGVLAWVARRRQARKAA